MKDIFKTSTGEYVNAVEIEQKLSKNRYIEFAVVISQNRKYTTALLFVDKEKFENAKKLNKNLTIEEYYNKDDILKNISNHINSVNSGLNKWEKIVNYKILTNDISIETGELPKAFPSNIQFPKVSPSKLSISKSSGRSAM